MSGNWIQKTEENLELFTAMGKGAEAARMLEISGANKIIHDRYQAIILQVNRLVESRFMRLKERNLAIAVLDQNDIPKSKIKENRFAWIKEINDGVEIYQATIEGKTRSDFKEVAIAQGIGAARKMLKNELENLANR